MGTTVDADSPVKRLAYAFVALLAGLATLLLYLLQNALRARSALLAVHVGEPRRQVSFALELFVLYAIFSFVGWLSVGVPTALFLPVRCIARLSWPLTLAVGAVLAARSTRDPASAWSRSHLFSSGHAHDACLLNVGFLRLLCRLCGTAAEAHHGGQLTQSVDANRR